MGYIKNYNSIHNQISKVQGLVRYLQLYSWDEIVKVDSEQDTAGLREDIVNILNELEETLGDIVYEL
ncbi:hypothetical protein D3C74_339960 [compost metagenome]